MTVFLLSSCFIFSFFPLFPHFPFSFSYFFWFISSFYSFPFPVFCPLPCVSFLSSFFPSPSFWSFRISNIPLTFILYSPLLSPSPSHSLSLLTFTLTPSFSTAQSLSSSLCRPHLFSPSLHLAHLPHSHCYSHHFTLTLSLPSLTLRRPHHSPSVSSPSLLPSLLSCRV